MGHQSSETSERRVAIITGGASGIGRALSEELALKGVEVVIADRQTELAEEVRDGIRSSGGSATSVELDVRDFERFESVVRETVERTGRVDYLFNNAGIVVGGEIKDFELRDWYDVFDVDLRGVVHGIQAVYPLMIEQGFGHIVNIASLAGLITTTLSASYTASKHAVVGLSKALRVEAKAYGVRVSVVCPGVIRTPGLAGGTYGRLYFTAGPEVFRKSFEQMRPMDANVFARRVLRAVDRNRAIIVVPGIWRVAWYLERLSPWLLGKLSELIIGQARKQFFGAG